jgi:hypothetical protein
MSEQLFPKATPGLAGWQGGIYALPRNPFLVQCT